jgi:hypothetical protein
VSLKYNAAIMLAAAAAVAVAKYKLANLLVPPLRLDPCDAVGVFVLAAMFLVVVLSVVRIFHSDSKGFSSVAQRFYTIRSQQAFALAGFAVLGADVIALARHPSMRISAEWRNQLLAWLGVLGVTSTLIQLLVWAEQRSRYHLPIQWKRVGWVVALTTLALAISPEWDLDFSSQTAHILTVALGAIVVLIPMRFLLPVLVPRESHESVSETLFFTASETIAFSLGVLMVSFFFWESSVGAMTRARRDLFSIAPLLIAYAFLGQPLGLVPKDGLSG